MFNPEYYVEFLGSIYPETDQLLSDFYSQDWRTKITAKSDPNKLEGLKDGIKVIGLPNFLSNRNAARALSPEHQQTWKSLRLGVSEILFLGYLERRLDGRGCAIPRSTLAHYMDLSRQELPIECRKSLWCDLPDALVIKQSAPGFMVSSSMFEFRSSLIRWGDYREKRQSINDTFSTPSKMDLIASAIRSIINCPTSSVSFPKPKQIRHELIAPRKRIDESDPRSLDIFDNTHRVEMPSLRKISYLVLDQLVGKN